MTYRPSSNRAHMCEKNNNTGMCSRCCRLLFSPYRPITSLFTWTHAIADNELALSVGHKYEDQHPRQWPFFSILSIKIEPSAVLKALVLECCSYFPDRQFVLSAILNYFNVDQTVLLTIMMAMLTKGPVKKAELKWKCTDRLTSNYDVENQSYESDLFHAKKWWASQVALKVLFKWFWWGCWWWMHLYRPVSGRITA